MKRFGNLAIIIGLCLMMAGCAGVSVKPEFQKYKALYVSWLDLGELNYASFGYGSRDEWLKEIKVQNIEGLQKYTASYMRGWTVTGADSKNAPAPRTPDTLIVKFSNVMFNPTSFSIRCSMDFYDSMTGKLVKHVLAEPQTISYAPFGGWSNMSFGGRLMNGMYNLAYEIKYYMQN